MDRDLPARGRRRDQGRAVRRWWVGTLLAGLLLVGTIGAARHARADSSPSPDEVEAMIESKGTSATVMTVDDLFATRSYSSLTISPDGRWLAFTLRRPDEKANEWMADLWRLDLTEDNAEPVQLTRRGSVSRLAWSPDSRWIGFLTTREDGEGGKQDDEEAKPQVWRIAPDGGEAEAVTDWAPGVEGFAWAGPDRILFYAQEKKTLRERKLKEAKDDTRVVEDLEHWPAVRLFSIDLKIRKTNRLSANDDRIEGLWVRPDGRAWVTRHITSIYQESQPGGPWPRYFLHDEDTGGDREIFREPTFYPSRVAFLPGGKGLIAQYAYSRRTTSEYRSEAAIETLWRIDPATDERTRIDPGDMGLDEHLAHPAWLVTERGVLAVLADRTHGRPVLFREKNGKWETRELSGPGLPRWRALAADRAGRRMAWVYTSADEPERLLTGVLDGRKVEKERVVHRPNRQLESKCGRSEVVHWKSSRDGTEITGILTLPARGEGPYPMMVWIHGGPTGVDADNFENYWASFPHILAGMGIATLQPNYRGSVNHGLDYVEAITGGKYYELEIPDILDGVDAMIQRKVAQADRLGCIGWSNGSILSIALTVESDRFRVCCAGAGDVNWTSDFGNCAFGPNFDIGYLGDTPWGNPRLYLEKSPLFKMETVTTPTLIQFGEKDTNVPTSQGWEHYRALQLIGKAPVRFLLYPGMPHGLRKLSYQRRKVNEELAWISRYLLGRELPREEVLKEGSPLACVFEREKLAAHGEPVGTRQDGILVPPLASPALPSGVRLAAVELTRAMVAPALEDAELARRAEGLTGYQGDAAAYARRGDLPATGMSVEFARLYARWLSERTGRKWRLPTREELEQAAEIFPRSAAENTLDRWAGYSPTLDEAESLRERMHAAGDPSRWLREVATSGANRPKEAPPGAFADGALCYDLHGNAAEWCVDASGKAVVFGRCALDPADPAFAPPQDGGVRPPKALIGVRLVRDPD